LGINKDLTLRRRRGGGIINVAVSGGEGRGLFVLQKKRLLGRRGRFLFIVGGAEVV